MKRIALAAAGAAAVGLTACSHTAAPASTAPAGHRAASAVPVSCHQRYTTWANGGGKELLATFDAVSAAEAAGDSQALTVALKKAKPAVTEATRHPVPACADPRGYWNVLMMHVNAAVADKSSASSVQAALKGVPVIKRQLTAELQSVSQ